jgi:hypothetical protein
VSFECGDGTGTSRPSYHSKPRPLLQSDGETGIVHVEEREKCVYEAVMETVLLCELTIDPSETREEL